MVIRAARQEIKFFPFLCCSLVRTYSRDYILSHWLLYQGVFIYFVENYQNKTKNAKYAILVQF